MARHTLALNPEVWLAAQKPVNDIGGRWPSDAWRLVQSDSGHRGRFRVALSRDVFELAGEITEPKGWDSAHAKLHPEWYFQEHLCLSFDPGHDHMIRRMVAVMRDGQVHKEDTFFLQGEELADGCKKTLSLTPLDLTIRVLETGSGWRVVVRIPRRSLCSGVPARKRGGPLGFQLRFGAGGAIVYPAATWPPEDPFWGVGPFGYGDVLEPSALLMMTGVDFGKPVWKTADVVSTVQLRGHLLRRGVTRGKCQIGIVSTDGRRAVESFDWKASGRHFAVDVPVAYPFQSKWAPDLLKTAKLEITVLGSRQEMLWRADYPFGFDAGIIVREPYGMLGRAGVGGRRPDADDPEFVEHYRAWLLRRLPAWRWVTSRHGAPSDFYLQAQKREDDIDLMRPAVLKDIARLIHRKFDDWQDGLYAAAMVLHHPCMTVHSGSWARLAGMADLATTLRLGGCFCSDCARIVAALGEELGRLYGVPMKGYTLGLRGHLSGLVETPIGDVLVDPMLGVCYHTLDNRRLATLEEMRQIGAISERMWALPYSSGGSHFFKGVANQVKRPWQDMPMTYPPSRG